MECKTARLFLPMLAELGTEEVDCLQEHLAVCQECDAVARATRRADAHLARAMKDVPVPVGLKGRIREKLAAGRAAEWRRWALTRVVQPLTVAAAVLLLAPVGSLAYSALWPVRVDLERVVNKANYQAVRDQAAANSELGHLGFGPCAPDFVKYEYLAGPPTRGAVPDYPHLQAPVFEFWGPGGHQRATIYVLRKGQFQNLSSEPLSTLRAEVFNPWEDEPSRDEGWRFLVLHTGDNWDWLRGP